MKNSNKEFEDYKHRAIVIAKRDNEEHRVDIYTDCLDKEQFIEHIKANVKQGVEFVRLDHWCTKEQDDRASELIEETLKDL